MKITFTSALLLALCSSFPALADKDDHLRPPANLPAALVVQAPEEFHFAATGVGVQIYDCKAAGNGFAWVLRGPDAILLSGDGDEDDRQIGIHYVGPNWADDHGSVQGAVAGRAPSPDPTAVAWLRLTAVAHTGNARFAHVTSILRLNTVGGVAPANGCDVDHVGAEVRVPYRASYFFFHLEDDNDE